jgi:hypothetical protein
VSSTPQKVRINGEDAILFRDGTPPVYVLGNGKFAVHWDGKWKKRASLRGIDSLITKDHPTLKIFSVDSGRVYYERRPQVVEAREFLEKKIINAEGKRVYKGYGQWFVFEKELVDKLNELEERRTNAEKAFYDEFTRILKSARRVYTTNFGTLLKHQGEPQPEEDEQVDLEDLEGEEE